MNISLERLSATIDAKHRELGYKCGWRFLYTTAATLACSNGLLFLGLNPGGDGREGYPANVCNALDHGNAYYTEKNWDAKGENALQKQVKLFFELLAKSPLGKNRSSTQLMDETLTSNFCPFRSPSWKVLPRREEAVSFSTQFWTELLPQTKPRVILCMAGMTYSSIGSLLKKISVKCGDEMLLPTGWGQMKFAIRQYNMSSEWNPALARIPHLSRYKIMSHDPSLSPIGNFIAKLAEMAA